MAILALATAAKQFVERHLSTGNRSPSQVAAIAALGILIAAIIRYPDTALFVRDRPDFKKKTIKGHPLVGNMLQGLMAKDPLLQLKTGFDTYGDIFSITVPYRGRIIMINSPELIEHILKTNFDNYIKGNVFSDQLRDIFGTGIFVSDGERWRWHRRISSNIFTAKMYRQVTGGAFIESARALCSVFDRNEALGKPMDLQALFLKMTMDAFGKLIIGADFNTLTTEGPHEFGDAFDYLVANVDNRIANPFWQWTDYFTPGKRANLKHAIGVLDGFANEAVRNRRKETEEERAKRPKDLIDHYIGRTHEDGTALTDTEIRDVIVSFMVAGRDTTGYTLTWQFYALMAYPRIMKNVLEELKIVLRGSEDYTYETILHELPYLKAVFHETLRLYPSVPRNIKEAVNDDVLPDGTRVYKGDPIAFSTWCMGRNRSVWGEDAEVFVPERWLVDNKSVSEPAGPAASNGTHGVSPFGKFKMESQFKFNSFNASPRLCLGQTIATLEAMVTSCMLLQNFDMELVPGRPVPEPKPSAALPMKHGLLIYAKRRRGHVVSVAA
ncbi:cytochrome P450 [Gamsiella multidivaricata]|uniref:cytochrome P450 n=1 Tax=Gamsiella multidivaricata TaxID=101098 RepID=UPI00221EB77C|nr:cytochrome P450 [Gamsiella multidivaricata]KAG0365389.1 hypothetical protein BGZ54_006568 [Gamsiella multidivaricata]KAI7818161.1 cytochrome P450 [Gamsiella multidivaricata]